jgi:hypothetical protein
MALVGKGLLKGDPLWHACGTALLAIMCNVIGPVTIKGIAHTERSAQLSAYLSIPTLRKGLLTSHYRPAICCVTITASLRVVSGPFPSSLPQRSSSAGGNCGDQAPQLHQQIPTSIKVETLVMPPLIRSLCHLYVRSEYS